MKYLDKNTSASDSLKLKLSDKKLLLLRNDLIGLSGLKKKLESFFLRKVDQKRYIKEHIFYGDSQPAIVISLQPLRIAAYSDELDCVAMLEFPDEIRQVYTLEVGTRLITINTYKGIPPYHEDLLIGSNNLGNWYGFNPIIADFVSDDMRIIEQRKLLITEDIWTYVFNLAFEYFFHNPDTYRSGKPFYSRVPSVNGIKRM